MPLALSGIRVLDLTRLMPGALCTLLLADLGANVIKIESPDGGDYARLLSPAFFALSNRNKRSAVINLKTGADVLKKLVERADVLVESYRPGVMARLGCDYDTLKAINPRLVFCAMSGWGQDGPYAQREGHDLNYVALAGILGMMGTPQPLGGQVADVGGAYLALAGILAALFKREREGVGSFVDIGLFESALPFVAYSWSESQTLGSGAGGGGALTGALACYNVYTAKDGHPVALAALEPKFWANFCSTIDRPDLIPDYADPDRQRYLKTEVAEIFARRTAQEWHDLLHDAECCFSLVTTPDQLALDEQVRARNLAGADKNGAWMRSPLRIAGDDMPLGAVPAYGAHTRVILREAGYTSAEVDALIAAGKAR
ncbi:MAG: CoA transferase [Chloroflexi bacterium]|nr:CoA transferase [Chloroflexota bacterium]